MADAVHKKPPASLEAERSVLGALLIDNLAFDRVADILMREDFSIKGHQLIYEVVEQQSQKGQAYDVLTIIEALKQRSQLEAVGGEQVLFQLVDQTPSAAHVESYAGIVRDRSLLRSMLQYTTEIIETVYQPDGRSGTDVVDMAEMKLYQLTQYRNNTQGPEAIQKILSRTTERIEELSTRAESITGVPTGFTDFDEMTAGLQAGDLVIVAGRPSMGKTAFALNIAENVALLTSRPVLVFSLEMQSDLLAVRLLSSLGRIDQSRLRTGKLLEDDWPRLTSAMQMLHNSQLFIDDTPGLTPTELRARARRMKRKHKDLGLIVVDYLQLMSVPHYKDNRTQEISEISRSLKLIAKELNVPVVALSQLNRSLESRQDKRPMMSDLRESGAIEQDADVICFIYRDEVYNVDTQEKGIAEIIISKQRNGPIGKVKLTYLGPYTRFENHVHNNWQ